MSDDPRVVETDHAPTPFTAAEIRTGCPEGRRVTVRNVDSNQQSSYSTTTFTECDEAGSVLVNQAIDEQGKPIRQPNRFRATWDELQSHASFPVERTTITTESITTPIGEHNCLRYDIDDGERIRTLWFATSLPGLPIRTQEGEGAGARLSSELIGDDYA
jgi:hypothetical protein